MDEVPSPCTGVCRIDPAAGWCLGCRRTLGEIAAWRDMAAKDRRAILGQLAARGGR